MTAPPEPEGRAGKGLPGRPEAVEARRPAETEGGRGAAQGAPEARPEAPDVAPPPPEAAAAPEVAPPPPEVAAPPAERSPGPTPRARGAGAWSDEQAGLAGARGDVAWAQRRSQVDLASTLVAFVLALGLGTLLVAPLDAAPPLLIFVFAGAMGAALLLGWWRARRLKAELARRALHRDQALRAAAPLVDDPAVRRPGRDLLALEGWREGLPVELSAPTRIAPDEAHGEGREDALVVRVGAPPASRRPRAVTRLDWLSAPTTGVPDSLAGWRAQRSLAALRATELLQRFGLASIAWGPDGVELRGAADHRLLGRDRLDALLAGAVALAQACGLVAVTRVRVVGEQASQVACPYCRDELAVAERAACLACGTEHHLQCLAEHGRCTVWGCGRPWVQARARAPRAGA